METGLLNDIIIIFGLSIIILFTFHLTRLPTIVGFLLTGMLAGPHGLGIITAVQEVEVLAEIGIVLLLFTIGMELSLKDLWKIKKAVILGGLLQVILTILVASALTSQLGMRTGEAIFIGFLISLSSTAIVLKLLQERAEIDSPHGRTSLAILIFQDIIVVPMILLTPMLAGGTEDPGMSILLLMLKGTGIILLIILGAGWIMPDIMFQIARTRSRELFLLSVIFICLAVAWITSSLGLSLALGAFLAGLIISESEYSHHALGNILPFRDVFMSFFFVSIGMLLNIHFLIQNPEVIILMALAVIIIKALITGSATALLGYPYRTAILSGLALGQVGEFSFILSKFGVEQGFLEGESYQYFLAVSIVTMAATPFIAKIAPSAADSILKLPGLRGISPGLYPVHGNKIVDKKTQFKDHLIIVGYGVNGRNVSRAARIAGIQYIIVETNPETVRNEQEKGELIFFGEATQDAVLEHAGIKEARVLVIAISDPVATRRIISIASKINPRIQIIARTRYLQEMKPLYDLGADEVIPEEFETSVEIFVRVLKKYLIPRDVIEKFIAEVRSDGYEMFRSLAREPLNSSDLKLNIPDVEINSFKVGKSSPLAGKTLAEIELRKKFGVTLLAIRRDTETLSNPHGDIQLFAGDILIILGQPDKIALISSLFFHQEETGI